MNRKLTDEEMALIAGNARLADEEAGGGEPPIVVTGSPPPPVVVTGSPPPPVVVTGSPPPPIVVTGGGGGDPPKPPSCLSPGVNADRNFLSEREGGQKLQGYVPKVNSPNGPIPSPSSGVTIGTGVDLYGKSQAALEAFGLTPSEAQYLAQYNTYQGQAAENIVSGNNPNLSAPSISQDAADRLDTGAFTDYYNKIAAEFNSDASFADLQQLPGGAQTAIVSLAYQYGINLRTATPNFWNQITNGQWADAVANLRNFGDDFGPRRNLEADQLEQAVENQAMPGPNNPC